MNESVTRNGFRLYRSRGKMGHSIYLAVTAIVLLLLIFVCAIVFLFAIEAIRIEDIAQISVGGSMIALDWSLFSWLERTSIVIGSVFIGLVLLVILFRVVTPQRRSSNLHLLEADESGFVVVDSRGISTIAAQAALTAPGVADAETSILGTGFSPVRVKVGIGIYPRTDLLATGKEVRASVKNAVERYAGIEVSDVSVKAHIIDADSFGRLLE